MYARIYVKAETYIRKKPRRVSQRSGAPILIFLFSNFQRFRSTFGRFIPEELFNISTFSYRTMPAA